MHKSFATAIACLFAVSLSLGFVLASTAAPVPGQPDPIRVNGWRFRSGTTGTIFDAQGNAGPVFTDAGTTVTTALDGQLSAPGVVIGAQAGAARVQASADANDYMEVEDTGDTFNVILNASQELLCNAGTAGCAVSDDLSVGDDLSVTDLTTTALLSVTGATVTLATGVSIDAGASGTINVGTSAGDTLVVQGFAAQGAADFNTDIQVGTAGAPIATIKKYVSTVNIASLAANVCVSTGSITWTPSAAGVDADDKCTLAAQPGPGGALITANPFAGGVNLYGCNVTTSAKDPPSTSLTVWCVED